MSAVLRFAAAALVAASVASLATSAPAPPPDPPLSADLAAAKRDAAAAKAQQRRLEQAAERARDEADRVHARQLAAAQAIAAAEAEIGAADAEARILQLELDSRRRRLASEQAPLSNLLAALVLQGRRPPIFAVADPGSVQELVRLRILIDAVAPAIRARTAALAADLDRTRQLRSAALAAAATGRRKRGELAVAKQEFAALERSAAQLALRRGGQALGAGDVALASEQRFADLQLAAPSLAQSVRTANELKALGPAPLPPVAIDREAPFAFMLPAKAAVKEGFGAISDSGVRSRGTVLATSRGTALAAPADGTIVFAGPFGEFDGVVIIDHGNGWKSVLVNAASPLGKGARVALGQPLGTALGDVEIELQRRGVAVSPAIIAGSSAMLSNSRKGG